MPPAKKLQVFVSSTYTDLKDERQAAVEAILAAGHIPAGMELFAAGDQSQMTVIRRWIDESDVFLLILGGRYGSVELSSGKSYTHLEFEYASSRGKPVFAVVITDQALDEKVKQFGRAVLETENAKQLNEFRRMVLDTRIVKFWSDPRDIKLAVHETMGDLSRRADLVGWIPGDQSVNTSLLAEEIARLTKENAELRARLAASADAGVTYNGLTYEQMIALLNEPVDLEGIGSGFSLRWIKAAAEEFGHTDLMLLHVLWGLRERLSAGGGIQSNDWQYPFLMRLAFLGLLDLQLENTFSGRYNFELTPDGKKFLLHLLAMRVAPGASGGGASSADPALPGPAA